MKAAELVKKEKSIKELYEQIKQANERGDFKVFIPHQVYVSENIKMELIQNGFKIGIGDWDGIMKNALIIEW